MDLLGPNLQKFKDDFEKNPKKAIENFEKLNDKQKQALLNQLDDKLDDKLKGQLERMRSPDAVGGVFFTPVEVITENDFPLENSTQESIDTKFQASSQKCHHLEVLNL